MKMIKKIYTIKIIAMIVLPLPPSTIIALAIISTPQGRKYLDDDMMKTFKIAKEKAVHGAKSMLKSK